MINWVQTARAVNITVNGNIPGANPSSTGPGGIIANFYTFALLIAGLLAFGAIVWGGIKYATGRGNPSAESEGKSWITNALLGLLLLAGAYIILYTINPNILNLQLPTLTALPTTSSTGMANSASAACSNSNHQGTCPNPATQICLKGAGGNYQCVTMVTTSN